PTVDADLVALGHDAALLVGMQQRGDPRHVKGRGHRMALQNLKDARHALAVAVLAPAHAAERFAALAQLVGLMIAVEGERERAARAVLPGGRPQRAPGAHVIDDAAPLFFRPLPRFEVMSGVVHGVLLVVHTNGEPVTGNTWPVIQDA